MKKFVLALTVIAAMTGAASAADLGARPYTKAPVTAPVANWTGCYLGAGGGGAMTNNDNNIYDPVTGTAFTSNQTNGARGWFGTVQGGCDYQFQNWVVGGFADYDFMDVRGDTNMGTFATGQMKQDWQWAVGARVGYLVLPQLLTYVSGGYTQAHWKDTTLSFTGLPQFTSPGFTKGGWFIGTGDEYALTGFLPGLFWKTEYRYSEFDRQNSPINDFATGALLVNSTQKFREHSVRSELVYRFNWGAPLVAKY
ncbi:porin family protein [Bradyrhizobium manausense]|uniref:outer membrane protein n=1 Tax=Bradyrhizobium TaxID=374 RepID=UPI001BAC9A81|nr:MULTISPECIES: outer membrane beta-barrel protein [Bradyrhizobium]MBR0828382.1 porin family protein [Bradyrhizobium manausense]UVO25552.1 outer membrane beta-barrel protein [Bradyrhizobium arachidis]